MSDPITVTIGGEVVTVPTPVPFTVLKRAGPAIRELLQPGNDTIASLSLAIQIVSAAVIKGKPTMSAQHIEETLLPDEWQGLLGSIRPILKASGLVKDPLPGEASASEGTPDPTI